MDELLEAAYEDRNGGEVDTSIDPQWTCVNDCPNPVTDEDGTCSDECYLDVYGVLPPDPEEDA